MRAFVVRAAESGWPIPGVYDDLLEGRATIGWSELDSQDLRVIAEALHKGRMLDGDQQDARRCLGFLEKPESGHLLLYPHQPETGRFLVVEVDGDYDYAPPGRDFRSHRPCTLVTLAPVSMYDAVVPAKLRQDLGRQGRFYEIHDTRALESFLADVDQAGRTDRSSGPALTRIHAMLRRHVPDALATEFSRHDLSRKFCTDLFARMGHQVELREGPWEAGSDLVVLLENSLLPEDVQLRIGVQVFAYTGEVSDHALAAKLHQLVQGWEVNDLSYGVLLTTGTCTPDARRTVAEHNRANLDRLVRLIDADDLADLFLRYFPPQND